MQWSHLKLRVVLLRSLLLALALAGRTATAASVEFSIPPIGTNLPILSWQFGIENYAPLSPLIATVTSGSMGREVDGYSPAFQTAVILGTLFPTATLSMCKTACGSATTYLTLTLQDVLFTSYSVSAGSGGSSLFESIGLTYSSMTAAYLENSAPPPEGKTAWGWMLPADLPVGGAEPYAFAFDIDVVAAEVLFNRPLSTLGDGMSATLFNTAVVPIPPSVWLLATGIASLGGRRVLLRKAT